MKKLQISLFGLFILLWGFSPVHAMMKNDGDADEEVPVERRVSPPPVAPAVQEPITADISAMHLEACRLEVVDTLLKKTTRGGLEGVFTRFRKQNILPEAQLSDGTLDITCAFIYAWAENEDFKDSYMYRLAKDLGLILKTVVGADGPIPGETMAFNINNLVRGEKGKYVVFAGSRLAVAKAYDPKSILSREYRGLIGAMEEPAYRSRCLYLLLDGDKGTAFPADIQDPAFIDFRETNGRDRTTHQSTYGSRNYLGGLLSLFQELVALKIQASVVTQEQTVRQTRLGNFLKNERKIAIDEIVTKNLGIARTQEFEGQLRDRIQQTIENRAKHETVLHAQVEAETDTALKLALDAMFTADAYT